MILSDTLPNFSILHCTGTFWWEMDEIWVLSINSISNLRHNDATYAMELMKIHLDLDAVIRSNLVFLSRVAIEFYRRGFSRTLPFRFPGSKE